MWDIVLTVSAIVFFVLIALQIIYIRSSLATYQKDKYNILSSGNTNVIGSVNNTIKVYGLDVHKNHTTIVNDTTKFNNIAIPDNLYVLCGDIPMSKDVTFNKGVWLVLNRNEGCNNLLQDVLSKRTRYILIDNIIYVVHFDREHVETLRMNLDENQYVDKAQLSDQEFIYITKIENSFDFVDPANSKECTPISSMRVFKLGTSTPSTTGILDQVKLMGSDLQLVIVGFITG